MARRSPWCASPIRAQPGTLLASTTATKPTSGGGWWGGGGFFEALNYEAIEQKKAYNLAGLLGDIGGQMGLFIGASVLTVLEILDYIYEVIRDKVAHGLRRPKPPMKKPSGSIATLGLEEIKEQSPCETLGHHAEGTYPTGLLPNHHHRHHYSPQGVFEDFAC
ncbi:hypothetical protein lerEdw1_003348 [Lerista edwardsae]|nr:hypothetical protein lerEdw1_003348 [Lerista edwardsae]